MHRRPFLPTSAGMTQALRTTFLSGAFALAGVIAITAAAVAQQATPQTNRQQQTAAGTPSWQPFTSSQFGFSVQMPGQPTENAAPSASGRSTLHRFYVSSPNGDTMYLVQVSEPQAGQTRLTVPEDIAQRYARGSGTEVVSQRATTFAGKPGREATFHDAKNNLDHRVVWVVANNHAYLIAAAGSHQFVDGANARHFFDSFRLNG